MAHWLTNLTLRARSIFRFNFNVTPYQFQFHVHEMDQDIAQSHLEKMVDLYTNGHALVARAKLDAGLKSNKADKITRIADVLSRSTFNYSDIKVAVEEDDESYYGRKFSDKSALFSVFGLSGFEIDSFDLKVDDFDTYRARALSQDRNYFSSLMSRIDCFNRDFHQQLPPPFHIYYNDPYEKIPYYDPIMLKEHMKRLDQHYKTSEIPIDAFGYDTDYFDQQSAPYQFVLDNNNFIINRQDYFGITPLMEAASRVSISIYATPITLEKRLESIKIMLRDRSIDINQQDIFGRTALMHVVLRLYFDGDMPGKEAVTKLLLEHGADPLVTDYLGKCALDYFIEYCGENHPAYRLLLEKSNSLAKEHVAKVKIKGPSHLLTFMKSNKSEEEQAASTPEDLGSYKL